MLGYTYSFHFYSITEVFNCPHLHYTKLHCTTSAVYLDESTSLQCPALYHTDCLAVQYKAFIYNAIIQWRDITTAQLLNTHKL